MKKVIVFTTGGTIAMKYDEEKGGLVPAVSGEDLAAAVPGLSEVTEVEVREFSGLWKKSVSLLIRPQERGRKFCRYET
ncbi:MAG: asparaginase domain-containing protein [Sutterellaceae bacterium]|nr:asparaginase domain-containing protein [Sutterellaceae bacterium]MDD7441505.1 asparaginase domain-containing protein [Sutterellaceae bacterium]